MNNLGKHLLMGAALMGLAAEQNEKYFAEKSPVRIMRNNEERNSLHHSKKQRKTRKNRRRTASKMRAYNRKNNS